MHVSENVDRRSFLGRGVLVGGCVAACPFLLRQSARAAGRYTFDETMGYCCAECTPEKCAFLSHDPEVKRKKAEELTKKLGRPIAPEDVHCSKCRIPDAQAYDAIRACPIRQCVIGKGLVSCAHCPDLDACEKGVNKERAQRVREGLS